MGMPDSPSAKLDPTTLNWVQRIQLKTLLRVCSSAGRMTEAEIDAWSPSENLDTTGFERLNSRLPSTVSWKDARVLEVGCGTGDLAICMARAGARVTAIDIDAARIRVALDNAAKAGSRVDFQHGSFLDLETDGSFDYVVSYAAFEHIEKPEAFLPAMARAIKPEGRIIAMFGPLWWSPYGPHQNGFTWLPWVHFIYSEPVVLSARRQMFRPTDPATRYEEIRGGLNRLTLGRFETLVKESGLRFEEKKLNPQLRNPMLAATSALAIRLPGLRELAAHTVLCVLSKA